MILSRAPVDADLPRAFYQYALLQPVTTGAEDGRLRRIARERHRPRLPKNQFRPRRGGIPGQTIIARKRIAQRDSQLAVNRRERAERGENAGAANVVGSQVLRGLAHGFPARLVVDVRLLPYDPVFRLPMSQPVPASRANPA